MSEELKPCPFCGATGLELFHAYRFMKCEKCGAEGPVENAEHNAIEIWNDRTPETMTSVIRWVRYDGTPETLPENYKTLLLCPVHGGGVFPAYRWEYESHEFWQVLASESRRIEIGDLWAYLPEPPESTNAPA